MTDPAPHEPAPSHPLLDESDLPYGLPDFGAIADDDLEPAIRAAIDDHRAEIAAIVADPEPAGVANTIVALERSGRALHRALSVFYGLLGPDATPERLAVDRVVSPLVAAHSSEVMLDAGLFARVDAVHADLERGAITPDAETERLVRRLHRDFVRAGARLGDADQRRLAEIDRRLAELGTTFGENLLASTAELAVDVADEAELAGVPAAMREGFAAAARDAGREGWRIPLGLPTVQPVTAVADDPALRRRVLAASLARGGTAGHDNGPLVLETVRLRAERAALLGFPSHAAFVLAEETAATPEAARGLLTDLVDAAVTNARHEAKDMRDGADEDVDPADWAWLARRLRADRFDVDEDEVSRYFDHARVLRDGAMYAAGRLYGLSFVDRPDLRAYRDDVRVVEVLDRDPESGEEIGVGLLVVDPFARPTKRGGAWMSSFVDQSRLLGTRAVVVNVQNLPAPDAAGRVRMSFDDVVTTFHEFGHALHGLLSDVEYPTFSGTSVPRDFVEFPSQVNEMWARDPGVLARMSGDPATGEPIPADLLDRLWEAERFGQGQATVEYLAAALLDLAWHSLSVDEAAAVTDVDAFEADVLAGAGLDVPGVEPRYRSRYFQHVFAGGYSAAYYSYLWAEVLDADAAGWFRERGGLDATSGTRMRRAVLSRGGTVDAGDAFRGLVGRDPRPDALLERRGLAGAATGGPRP